MKNQKIKYAPIRAVLAEHERKMNQIIISLCVVFALMSIFYILRSLLGEFYSPEDGLYYYQLYFEIGSCVLLTGCIIATALTKKSHPGLARYIFFAVYLVKAVCGTIFYEFNYFILYIIPVMFCIGYYDTGYSVIVNTGTLVSYIASEIIACYHGIINISFYNVDHVDGLIFTFNNTNYVSNRILAQALPVGSMLFFVCFVSVLLTKIGAETLLREARINSEKAALDKEMQLGKDIQQSMLPDRVCRTPYYSAFSYMVSAKNVGGDFFDYFPLGEDKVLITIGDVSGKGISASLFASNTKALIRAYATGGYSPKDILTHVNATLCSTNKKKLFVTIWLGILDLTNGICTYSNAGHNPPLLKKADGGVSRIDSRPNFVIGRRQKIQYSQYDIQLVPTDNLILYTDGITEAMNGQGELYGEARWMDFVRENTVDEQFTKDLRKSIVDFRGDAEQSDDISLACLVYTKKKTDITAEQSFVATSQDFLRFREFVMGFAGKYTEDRKTLNDIELSLGEIFSNIQFYGTSDQGTEAEVTAKLTYVGGLLSMEISDTGIAFDPLQQRKPSLEENRKKGILGGFGIYMVRQLMDDLSYEYNGKNTLTLKKRLKEVAE